MGFANWADNFCVRWGVPYLTATYDIIGVYDYIIDLAGIIAYMMDLLNNVIFDCQGLREQESVAFGKSAKGRRLPEHGCGSWGS